MHTSSLDKMTLVELHQAQQGMKETVQKLATDLHQVDLRIKELTKESAEQILLELLKKGHEHPSRNATAYRQVMFAGKSTEELKKIRNSWTKIQMIMAYKGGNLIVCHETYHWEITWEGELIQQLMNTRPNGWYHEGPWTWELIRELQARIDNVTTLVLENAHKVKEKHREEHRCPVDL